VHLAGQPEIEIEGGTATGTWAFQDTVIATKYQMVVHGAAFYRDRYLRGPDAPGGSPTPDYRRTYEATLSPRRPAQLPPDVEPLADAATQPTTG